MSERIRERLERLEPLHRIVNGEYVDEFTTVIDNRTAKEILSRLPKCCQQKDVVLPDKKHGPKSQITET
ncbi:hypothetical protein LCGC14_1365770 [marine sediment metagenome]|uniref:Uncharacterized protein n=1 Tax=marine sediment metagenome TaxID=412755 RepID=A0A0F9N8Y8_9ZZZZ